MSVFARFATVLDYPEDDFAEAIDRCLADPACLAAAVPLLRFRDFVRGRTTTELQERYAGTFDFNPDCCMYAGHHLLGGDERRGVLMARLAAQYRKRGFSARGELPDHLVVMLRYAASNERDADTPELIADCIVPTLAVLTTALEKRNDPWADVVRSVALVLEEYREPAIATDPAKPTLELTR